MSFHFPKKVFVLLVRIKLRVRVEVKVRVSRNTFSVKRSCPLRQVY